MVNSCLGIYKIIVDHLSPEVKLSSSTLYWSVLALCRELVWIQHLGLHICIQKSSIRLGLVHFRFKEVRSYFRKVSGVVEKCGCGRSGLGSDVETK